MISRFNFVFKTHWKSEWYQQAVKKTQQIIILEWDKIKANKCIKTREWTNKIKLKENKAEIKMRAGHYKIVNRLKLIVFITITQSPLFC